LYDAETDARTGAPVFKLKSMYDFNDLANSGWVLVDEASMVSKQVWDHLSTVATRVGFPVVVMGDLFQLPPVSKGPSEEGFSLLEVPTEYSVNLTEVHRQALDSPIVRASMILRSNDPEFSAMRLLRSVGQASLLDETRSTRTRGGVVLCHTNMRRHKLNEAARVDLGYDRETLHPGEPLLVTQNNYQLDRYNGEVVTFKRWLHGPDREFVVRDRYTNSALEMHFGVGAIGVEDRDEPATLAIEEVSGRSEEAKIGAWNTRKCARYACSTLYDDEELVPSHLHANFGYALTVHKAQGSEWPDVLVVLEDSMDRLRGIERRRWLYTAITRSRETVSYVKVD